jgi:hypothetical protein
MATKMAILIRFAYSPSGHTVGGYRGDGRAFPFRAVRTRTGDFPNYVTRKQGLDFPLPIDEGGGRLLPYSGRKRQSGLDGW